MHARTRWGVLIAAVYLLSVLVEMPAVGPEFSPDTLGYVEFSPYRQPLYGLWANSTYALLGSWQAVKILQLELFALLSAWVIIELGAVPILGILASSLFAAMLAVLGRLGLLNLVGSIISEGLFFPMLILMMAMLLAWLRSGRTVLLVGLTLLIVGMTQLRTAALLVFALPLFSALFIVIVQSWRTTAGRSGLIVIGTLVAALACFPSLLGKSVFHLSTAADSMGLALLPRVSLLPPTEEVRKRSPAWTAMSSSWRSAASEMGPIALTQFDAQLQEAIRFDIGPKVLLPSMLNRDQHEILAGWLKGVYFDGAKKIAFSWILEEWPTYARLSAAHLWGMLTVANFMGNKDRKQVWEGLQSVSELTWRVAPFRTDYPLNRVYEPLSWTTGLLYFLIRYASIGLLILGVASALGVLRQALNNRYISPGSLAIALAVGWCVAHSIPAALTVFPEYRFTYANMLVMFSGGAIWLAYLRANRESANARDVAH